MSHAVTTINGHTVAITGPDAETELRKFAELQVSFAHAVESYVMTKLTKMLIDPDGWLTKYPHLGITTACAGATRPYLMDGCSAEPMFTHPRLVIAFSTNLKNHHGNRKEDSPVPDSD